jgi:hypothetical protein
VGAAEERPSGQSNVTGEVERAGLDLGPAGKDLIGRPIGFRSHNGDFMEMSVRGLDRGTMKTPLAGAHSERRGDVRPVRSLLGGKGLTRRFSFAKFPYLLVRNLTRNRAILIKFVITVR